MRWPRPIRVQRPPEVGGLEDSQRALRIAEEREKRTREALHRRRVVVTGNHFSDWIGEGLGVVK